MPTYEYRCPKGHEFEVFQRITSEPGALCPECGEKAERQLSSGVGLLFKGSGFYITDYRSDSYKKSASSDKSGGGPEGGAESKSKPKDAGGSESKSKSSDAGGSESRSKAKDTGGSSSGSSSGSSAGGSSSGSSGSGGSSGGSSSKSGD